VKLMPGDRMELRPGARQENRPQRGMLVEPFPGVPNQWYVLLDGAPASLAYMDYWFRKLSLLELIAEAAQ